MKIKKTNQVQKLKFLFPSIILLTFLFTSCDPAVEYQRVVQNNSDYDVKVLRGIGSWYMDGIDTIYIPTDTLTIYKNTSEAIFEFAGIGGVYDFEDCASITDSMPMLVCYDDSVKIIPDINKMDYWNFQLTKEYKNGGGICECRIVLTNERLAE